MNQNPLSIYRRATWKKSCTVAFLVLNLFGWNDSAMAAVKTWAGSAGSTDWITGANWGGTAPVSGDSLTFTSANASASNLLTNTLTTSAFNIAGITFNAGSSAYTLTGNDFALTGNVTNSSTNLQTINDNVAMTAVRTFTMTTGGGNITMGGNLSGTGGGITTAGAGTLTLSGTNSYTGTTIVANGTTLQLNSATALSTSSALTLNNGSTLALRGDANTTFTAASLANTPNGTITIDVNQLTGAGANKTLTLSNNFTSTATSVINVTGGNGYTLGLGTITGVGNSADGTFNVASGVNLSITGITGVAAGNDGYTITGSGNTTIGTITEASATNRGMSLTKSGSGALTLSGANNLRNNSTGASVVTLSAGTLNLANAAALSTGTGTGTTLTITGGALDATNGVTVLTFTGNAVAQNWNGSFTFTGTNSLNMGSGAVTIGAAGTATINANTLTVGAIGDSGFAFTKAGSGILTATTVTATGGTITNSAGTFNATGLVLAGNGAFSSTGGALTSTGQLSVSGGAAGTVNATSGTIGFTTFNRTTGGTVDFTGTLTNISTTATNSATAGILGGWATVNGGADFAMVSGGKIAAYTGQTALTSAGGGIQNATNFSLGSGLTLTSAVTANSLKISDLGTTSVLANGGNNITFNSQTGGLLYASGSSTSAYTISGTGVIGGGTASEFIVNTQQGTLTISSPIVSSTATTGSFTKAGAGTLILSGLSAYTGTNNIDAGTVKIGVAQSGATGPLGSGAGALIMGNGTTLDLQGNNVTVGSLTASIATASVTSSTAATLTTTYNNTANAYSGLTVGGAASLMIDGGSGNNTPFGTGALITGTGSLGFQNQTGTIRDNNIGSNLGSNGSLLFNGLGQIQNSASVTLGANNAVVINGTGNLWDYQQNGATGLTINGAVSGSGTISTKQGFNSNLVIAGDMTGFSGTWNFQNNGTTSNNSTKLLLTNTSASVAGSSSAVFTQSALLTGNTGSNAIAWAGAGSRTIALGDLTTTLLGSFTPGSTFLQNDTATTTATFQVGAIGNNSTYAGVIQNGTGSVAITKVGVGTWTLTGANTYTGTTTLNGGWINAGVADVASTSGALGNGGNITFTGGGLQYSAASASTDYSSRIKNSTSAIMIDTNGQIVTFASALPSTNTGGLTKSGTGTLTLSGANAYTGTTLVNAGTLALSGSGTFGTGSVTTSGGTIDLGTKSITNTLGALTGGGVVSNGTITNNSGTYDVQNGSVSAILAGSNALSKTTSNTVTLSGANTYSGGTTVNTGTLALSGSGTLGTGTVTTSGGTIDLGGKSITNSLGAITGGGVVSNGTITNNSGSYDVQNGTASAILAGSNGLKKSTSNTFILSGTNTYTGTTTVNGGILQVNVDQALGTTAGGTTVNSGAALKLNGVNYATAEALSINGTGVSGGGALVNNGTSTYAGLVTAATNATINTGGGTLTFTGGLDKTGTVLTLTGGGTVNVNTTGITGNTGSPNSDLVVDGTTANLNAANSYYGPTYIRNGGTINANVTNALPTSNGRSAVILDDTGTGSSTLALGANQSAASLTGASSSSVNLNSNTLTVGTSSGSTTFAGTISGTGGLTKDGASTQILSGTNTYTGATTLTGGTLMVSGTLATGSAVSVGATGTNNAILSGTGTINGTVNLAQGSGSGTSILASGTDGTIGTLNTGALTMGSGVQLKIDLNSDASTIDLLNVNGLLSLGNSTLALNDLGASTLTAGTTLVLAQFSVISGTFNGLADGSSVTLGSNTFTLNYGTLGGYSNDITLQIAAIPEPSTYAMMGLGIAALLIWQRKRRENIFDF